MLYRICEGFFCKATDEVKQSAEGQASAVLFSFALPHCLTNYKKNLFTFEVLKKPSSGRYEFKAVSI